MTQKRKNIIIWVSLAVVVVVGVVFYIVFACFSSCVAKGKTGPLSSADLKENNVRISSAEMFVDELVKNDAMGEIFGKNKVYTLEEDIELSQDQLETLLSGNLSFWGKLNGNGHKVKPEPNLILYKPLLDYVHAEATVEYVEFANWTLHVEDGRKTALIGTNEGLLHNVKLSNFTLGIEQLYPDKESSDTAIAALTVNNMGTIKNCVADVLVKVHAENISDPDFKCIVGGLVARNFINGRIEDIIADVEYPNELAALDTSKNRRRNDIGVIFGHGDIEHLKNITVISNHLGVGKNAHDVYELEIDPDATLYVVELEELAQKFGADNPWRSNNWNSDGTWWRVDESNTSLPTLKQTDL